MGIKKNSRLSLKVLLALGLGAMLFLPALPLAVFTWHSYRSEVRHLENQLLDTNNQIASLAEELLGSILQETADRLEDILPVTGGYRDLPFDHVEEIRADGTITASSISKDRIGTKIPEKFQWIPVNNSGGGHFEVSEVVEVSRLGSRRVSIRVYGNQPERNCLIAYLNPKFLYDRLTSRFDSIANRHVYAVDAAGSPIFYSVPELVNSPASLLSNSPVRRFQEGFTGTVRYSSSISGQDRIGYVKRMKETGWGIIVSADIAENMIDVRNRFLQLVPAMVLAGGLAFSIFFYFNYRLVLPLSELAREIGRKDRNPHLPVKASKAMERVVELKQLIDDLNAYIERGIAAEKKAVQAEKLATLGELTAGLAHEMGTPLSVVRGSAQLVKRKYIHDPPGVAALERIISQTERITELIRSLLDLARLEKAREEAIDLRTIVEKAWETVQVMYPEVEKDFQLPEKPVILPLRRRAMEHAFLNIFINACQAMNGAGKVMVRFPNMADNEEKMQLIEIEDTGPGIDREHIDHIFRPFFSTKSSGEGSGLGLAHADRVIREHNGTIEALSLKNRGALFRIALPKPTGDRAG